LLNMLRMPPMRRTRRTFQAVDGRRYL
jgi:hypothetical protein